MEIQTSNGVDIDNDKVKEGNEGDDDLSGLQELRMKEAATTCPRCKQGFCADHGLQNSNTLASLLFFLKQQKASNLET